MKVLYIITNSFWYGDNIALYNLMPHLIKDGVEPAFLVPSSSTAYKRFSEFTDLIYTYDIANFYYTQKTSKSDNAFKNILFRVLSPLKCLAADKTEFLHIVKRIEKLNINLVHTNNSGCVLGYRIAKALSIPHIWHIREYGDKDANWIYLPFRKTIINRMNAPFNYNITITEDIRRHFLLKNDNTRTIYDGPISYRKEPVISHDKDYFLYVGRIFQKKGVELLVDAFSKVIRKNNDVILKIAGSGDEEYVDKLKHKATSLGIDKNIEFLGYRDDVPELMSHAKAVIVPSCFEAFGFITTEAMFNGTQIVGYNTAGTKEQMDNVESFIGHQVCERFDNVDGLVSSIQKIIVSTVSHETLLKASEYVREQYNDKKSAQNVYHFYEEILK